MKWIVRLLAIPVMPVLLIFKWCVIWIVQYFSWLCRIASGMTFFFVVIGFVTKLGTSEQLIQMLAVSAFFFLIPQVIGAVFMAFLPTS